jgi:hypothetical protein
MKDRARSTLALSSRSTSGPGSSRSCSSKSAPSSTVGVPSTATGSCSSTTVKRRFARNARRRAAGAVDCFKPNRPAASLPSRDAPVVFALRGSLKQLVRLGGHRGWVRRQMLLDRLGRSERAAFALEHSWVYCSKFRAEKRPQLLHAEGRRLDLLDARRIAGDDVQLVRMPA